MWVLETNMGKCTVSFEDKELGIFLKLFLSQNVFCLIILQDWASAKNPQRSLPGNFIIIDCNKLKE